MRQVEPAGPTAASIVNHRGGGQKEIEKSPRADALLILASLEKLNKFSFFPNNTVQSSCTHDLKVDAFTGNKTMNKRN